MNKILFYVPDISTRDKEIISSHIQVPILIINQISKFNNVQLLTSKPKKGKIITDLIKNNNLVFFEDGVIRDIKEKNSSPNNSYNLIKVVQFLIKTKKFIEVNQISFFHSFGSSKVLFFTYVLKLLSPKNTRFYHTIDTGISQINLFPFKFAAKRINKVITSTNYSFKKIKISNTNKQLIKHGLNFEIHNNLKIKKRILYWRDPTYQNGADIVEQLFINLSKTHKKIKFTIAVRSHSENLFNKKRLIENNIDYMEYPYPKNIKIQDLLDESICVVMPFRKLSTNPQLSVLETMYSNTCIITTPIESNNEIIKHKINGFLISINQQEKWSKTIESLILDTDLAKKIGKNANNTIKKVFNWDNTFDKYSKLYK